MADETIPTIYASGVEINVTPWDFTLRLSMREGNTPKDVRPVANLIMSPQHAYVVAKMLTRAVEAYQRDIGEIHLPPRLLNDLGIEP